MGYLIGILFALGIILCIAELWGRSKHIGRVWSILFLISGGIIAGILVILLSSSAKNPPPKGGKAHLIWGIICIVLGLVGLVGLAPTSLFFIILGCYLIALSNGSIKNDDPKYYFENNSVTQNHSSSTSFNGGYIGEHNKGNTESTYTKKYDGGHNRTSTSQNGMLTPSSYEHKQSNNQSNDTEFKGGIYKKK